MGSTNFSHPARRSFDIRSGLENRLQLPVIYNNDGNAAALYAHQMHFWVCGQRSTLRSQQLWGRVWAAA
jgi:glucokinase